MMLAGGLIIAAIFALLFVAGAFRLSGRADELAEQSPGYGTDDDWPARVLNSVPHPSGDSE